MAGELAAILTKWGNPPKDMVDKLPKPTKRDNKPGSCKECGGWHGLPAVHLDYMGHASVTRALIETDEHWNWEPVAFTEAGEPLISNAGGHLRMWARLTVLGKTILCVGTCPANKPEPEKELIGDMLRNGAMRFGIGLGLWAKDEWNDLGTSAGSGESSAPSSPPAAPAAVADAAGASSGHGSPDAGDGPTAGDGPSPTDPYIARVNADAELGPTPPGAVRPVDMVNLIRALDQQTRADIKEYARSKGYKVTPASLTQVQADDLAAWLDRREQAAS